ncbi:hypothetical protein FJU30_25615 [Affinibrenneria salicis]|uniref:Lipoprotein n=1 Tax=Affinibrenneria salicis TaxID=2590031 RepID=A0A5J5FQK4_9GAMM|nr:hypothetical protein FJU30_25615 [Affinibrenneria salicis]
MKRIIKFVSVAALITMLSGCLFPPFGGPGGGHGGGHGGGGGGGGPHGGFQGESIGQPGPR